MKTAINKLVCALSLVLALALLTGASSFFAQDNAGILTKDTRQIVNRKNAKYQKSRQHPIVIVQTLDNAKKTQPSGLNYAQKTVYIVVNVQKDGPKKASIYSSSDLHSQFTAQVRANLLRSVESDLAADSKLTVNRGIQNLFKMCVTLVDQHFHFPKDEYDLSADEISRVTKPADLRVPIMVGLLVVIIGLVTFWHFTVKRRLRR